jgi:pescadillo protein
MGQRIKKGKKGAAS